MRLERAVYHELFILYIYVILFSMCDCHVHSVDFLICDVETKVGQNVPQRFRSIRSPIILLKLKKKVLHVI